MLCTNDIIAKTPPAIEMTTATPMKQDMAFSFLVPSRLKITLIPLPQQHHHDRQHMKETNGMMQKISKPVSRKFHGDFFIGQPSKANLAIKDWGKASIMTLVARTQLLQ